jgi:murein DD-endopeptidase MepM/ murein hydrolase activator NlpD
MRAIQKHAFWIFLFALVAGLISAPSPQTARTRLADGFDHPVGKPDGVGYYKSRGFRSNYHMGEDWNGIEGGNTDLGKPVYSAGHGYVVLARDMRMGWGNLVIIRHTFLDGGQMRTVDSVYAHLDRILVREGKQVVRGQQIGTIGTNRGMYTAHLHFEIRKNLHIGYNQSGFAKDLSNYYRPTDFIEMRRKLPGAGRSALIAVNTFNIPNRAAPPSMDRLQGSERVQDAPKPDKKPFRVDRFEGLGSF